MEFVMDYTFISKSLRQMPTSLAIRSRFCKARSRA